MSMVQDPGMESEAPMGPRATLTATKHALIANK